MNYKNYRKKPVEIQAYQWDLTVDDPDVFVYTCKDGHKECESCGTPLESHGWIQTLEGGYIVCPGDFIVKGIQGEKYPVKPNIFHETYDSVWDD